MRVPVSSGTNLREVSGLGEGHSVLSKASCKVLQVPARGRIPSRAPPDQPLQGSLNLSPLAHDHGCSKPITNELDRPRACVPPSLDAQRERPRLSERKNGLAGRSASRRMHEPSRSPTDVVDPLHGVCVTAPGGLVVPGRELAPDCSRALLERDSDPVLVLGWKVCPNRPRHPNDHGAEGREREQGKPKPARRRTSVQCSRVIHARSVTSRDTVAKPSLPPGHTNQATNTVSHRGRSPAPTRVLPHTAAHP